MILLDANVLLYAANRDAPEYDVARSWLDGRLNGTARVGVPWPSILAFVRIASNPAILQRPVSPAVAWRQMQAWLSRDVVWIPLPGPGHIDVLTTLLDRRAMTSRLVPDAHLAALAIEHGLTLCSTDGDFGKFAGLKWENPLANP